MVSLLQAKFPCNGCTCKPLNQARCKFPFGLHLPHILLYHVNHMIVQMVSIAVEIVLLVPELQIHMHSFDICADIMQFVELFILNHLHHCVCFSNVGNANRTKAISVLIYSCLVAYIYCDLCKKKFDMQSICRWKNIKQFSAIRIRWISEFEFEKHSDMRN